MSVTAARIGALCLLVFTDATGQSLGFLKHSPWAQLTDDDRKLLREAVAAVLNGTNAGSDQAWSNTATGNSGKITLLSRFDSQDSRECRRIRIDTHTVRRGDGTLTTNMCRSAGSEWKTDADARPASP